MTGLLLVDTGPLVALLDADDAHHRASAKFAATVREQLVTTWPVITEVAYLTGRGGMPLSVLVTAVNRLRLRMHELDPEFLVRAAEVAKTYHPSKIDLADLSLLYAAEQLGCERVWTLDRRHFSVLRPMHTSHLTIVP